MAVNKDPVRTRLAYVIQEEVAHSTIEGITDIMSDTSHVVIAVYAPYKSFPNSLGVRFDPLLSVIISQGDQRINNTEASDMFLTGDTSVITEYFPGGDRKISVFIEADNFPAITAPSTTLYGVTVGLQFAVRSFNVHLILKSLAALQIGIRLDSEQLFSNFKTLDV